MPKSRNLQRALQLARIDMTTPLRQRPAPSPLSLALASLVALGASLGADALLVIIGTRLFPATKGFVHFRFSDYGLLTTIGVLAACAAWPVVTRASPSPRWLFLRLAVLVTLVLWLPDVWILLRGEPPKAVGVLIVMHLAIAVVTYSALVNIAVPKPPKALKVPKPPPETGGDEAGVRAPAEAARGRRLSEHSAAWVSMLGLVGLEFVLGVVALVAVPAGRRSGWVPSRGTVVYLLHSAVGAVLGVGAVVLLASAKHAERSVRISAVLGLVGVAIGAAGGLLTVPHGLRLLGMALMLVGAALAVLGYVMPAVGSTKEPAAT